MNRIAACLLLLSSFAPALVQAGEPCGHCRRCRVTAAGTETPYGDTGCGPRYWNAAHDECWLPDPCDACGRWRDCHGGMAAPEKLAPWQLPPGRGFQGGAAVGYTPPSCGACRSCGPRFWPF